MLHGGGRVIDAVRGSKEICYGMEGYKACLRGHLREIDESER